MGRLYRAFLDSDSYEDAVRNAVPPGGGSDALACAAGGIAEDFYGGVPSPIREKVKEIPAPDLWGMTEKFCNAKIEGPENDVHGS